MISLAICVNTSAQELVTMDSLLDKAGAFYSQDQFDSSAYYYNLVYQDNNLENKIQGLAGKIKINIYKNSFKEADSLLLIGDQLISNIPYTSAVCKYEIMKGEYFRKSSRFPEALALHKKTVLKSEKLQNASQLHADALLYTALTYERMGQYDSCLIYADRAYDVFFEISDTTDIRFSSVANSLGVCYYRANQFEKAKKLYLQAKKIAETKLGPTSADLSYVLGNLASLESEAQNYREAIKYAEQALRISKALKDEGGSASNYYSLGVYYYYLGDYGRAKDYLESCIEIRERIFHPLHSNLIWPYQVLGITLQESGDDENTIYFNKKAKDILIANYGPKSLEEGFLHENMATAYLNSGNTDSALVYIKKSSDILLRILPEDDYALGIHYFTLANMHYITSDYESAKRYIQESINVSTRIGATNTSDFAQNLALKGLIEAYLKNYDRAEELFQASLSIIRKGETFEYSSSAFWTLGTYARYQYDKYKRTGDQVALKIYNEYAAIYLDHSNKFRKQFNDPYTKSALIRNNVRIYNENIGIYHQLYAQTKDAQYLESAYLFSENGRTALLRDMQDGRIQHYAGVSDSLLAKELRLQKEITTLNQQYFEYPDSSSIKQSLFDAKEALNDHIEELLKTNPQYYNVKFNAKVMPLANVKEKLVREENLIEYMRDDTAYYALLINRKTTDLFYLGNRSMIDLKVVSWRKLITEQDVQKMNTVSAELYKYLFQPFEKQITGDRITIVPNGPLFYLNFETLSSTGQPDAYLIYKYNISYALSFNVLFSEKTKHNEKEKGIAIAIAPGFEDQIKRSYTTSLDTMEIVDSDFLHTVRQPWSVKLANKLKKEFRNNAFTGIEANEKNIKSNLHIGNVLYFGTHAITNAKDPLRSKLVLAKEIGEQNEDGYLHAYELYGLSLNADLAVLNACESGIGNLQEGEGMISLAYSLNFAGCPSTIMSLWKVDEKTNTKITDLFFENLANGQIKSEALRNAKLTFLTTADQSQMHPYYWSGMVLMGNDGDVYFKKKGSQKLILLSIGLIILGFLAWWSFRKKG